MEAIGLAAALVTFFWAGAVFGSRFVGQRHDRLMIQAHVIRLDRAIRKARSNSDEVPSDELALFANLPERLRDDARLLTNRQLRSASLELADKIEILPQVFSFGYSPNWQGFRLEPKVAWMQSLDSASDAAERVLRLTKKHF